MITFAIITDGTVSQRINEIIDSIERNNIPKYEILIVGGTEENVSRKNTRHVLFDESIKKAWITAKKNKATHEAKYDIIVYFHDYHVFDDNWYLEFVKFGFDWDIQMNQILMINGARMFDWIILDHPHAPWGTPVPYSRSDLVPYQYISGGYWVAKKHVGLEEPQNENLAHHQAEDTEWSRRVRNRYKIVMNPNSIVRHNKPHRENYSQKERVERLSGRFED